MTNLVLKELYRLKYQFNYQKTLISGWKYLSLKCFTIYYLSKVYDDEIVVQIFNGDNDGAMDNKLVEKQTDIPMTTSSYTLCHLTENYFWQLVEFFIRKSELKVFE